MAAIIVRPDDSAAAPDNRSAIASATGLAEFTNGGTVYVSEAPVLTETNTGVTLDGGTEGTTIEGLAATGNFIARGALAVRCGATGVAALSFAGEDPRPTTVPAGQVGWTFNYAGDQGFWQGPVTRYAAGEEVPVAADPEPHWMRAYNAVPFTGKASLVVPVGHGISKGDLVFITSGPMINECVGEWRRVASVTANRVRINKALRRTYTAGTIVSGPWPRDMTFKNLEFIGPAGGVFVQQAADIKFENCTFDDNAGGGVLLVAGCTGVKFKNCSIPCGLFISSSEDIECVNCDIATVVGEQSARTARFTGCTFGPQVFDTRIYSTDWVLRNCTFNTGVLGSFIYGGWRVEHCTAVDTVVTVRGGGAIVKRLTSNTTVAVQATYQGEPSDNSAGRNVTLDRVRATAITLGAGTSGKLLNCTGTITPANAETAAEWTHNGVQLTYP